MPREVDERKKRAALRKLRRAADLAEQGLGPPLSDWERDFLEEVEGRIQKYGSAFADPMKGDDGEALSSLQQVKLKEIDKKARGKARKGLRAKKPLGYKARTAEPEDSEGSEEAPPPPPPAKTRPALVPASSLTQVEPGKVVRLKNGKPKLTVIEGGGKKSES